MKNCINAKYRRLSRTIAIFLIILNFPTLATSMSLSALSVRSTTAFQALSRRGSPAISHATIHRMSMFTRTIANVPAPARFGISFAAGYHCKNPRPQRYRCSYQQTLLCAFSSTAHSNNPFEDSSKFSMGSKTDPSEFINISSRNTITMINDDRNDTDSATVMKEDQETARELGKAKVTTPSMEDSPLEQLKKELQRFRKQQSDSLNKPAYNILTNGALDGICTELPTTTEELLKVKGIGPKKVEMFGAQILTLVSTYRQELPLQGSDRLSESMKEEGDIDSAVSLGEATKEPQEKINKTQLKEDLRQYRMQQSEPLKKPAYTIFTNAALEDIYAYLPTTEEELLDVKGIGPKKVEMFGDDILSIVSKYVGSGVPRSDGGNEDRDNTPEKIDASSLTLEQRYAAEIPLGPDRKNVFITGSAGTGKSYLLKYLVEELKQQKNHLNEPKRVGICAPTGVAAVIVGGSTLHSFFGIGLGTGSVSNLLNKISKSSAAKKRIDETDVLIIDECSMLSSDLLEKLDLVTREIRSNGEFRESPFGGMQIIAFGDFFQLPPVYKDGGRGDRNWRPFCFDSQVWSDLGLSENIIELKEVQRQENENFISLLNKVRVGKVQDSDIRELNSRCLVSDTNPLPIDGIVPTRLYVLNKDVDSENESRLAELNSEEVVCEAIDKWRESMPLGTLAATKKKMKDGISMEMPDEVRLKVGAQVMLTRNKDLDKKLVNGSRGVVERFVDDGEGFSVPIVRFDCGIVTRISPVESVRYNTDGGKGCLVRMQVPLKLAWAITIHKSQGSTLTRALLDISSAFEYGQCYVALSRVKCLEGLWLERPAKLSNIMVSPQVIDFFRTPP